MLFAGQRKCAQGESGARIIFDNIKADVIVKYNKIYERIKKYGITFYGKTSVATSSLSSTVDSKKAKNIALNTKLQQPQNILNS